MPTSGSSERTAARATIEKAGAVLARRRDEIPASFVEQIYGRAVPEDAPLKFIPATWHPYVIDRSGRIDRRYYELCALWELRAAGA